MNRERREIEGVMKESAIDNLAEIPHENAFSLCLFDPSWHQGVIGILASRLKEQYHRPVIVFAPGEERTPSGDVVLKGSGRSISGFHLRDAIDIISKKYPDLILKFGGHAMAAGLSIAHQDLSQFQQAFESAAALLIDEDNLHRKLVHDGELSEEMINPVLAEQLANEIWGQGFPEPVFTGEFRVTKQSILKNKHLKLELVPASSSSNKTLLGIWFGHVDLLPEKTHLAYRLLIDHYLGYPRAQMHIEAAFDVS
jgi:single-stranded-DNA-specific exonuclease